MTNAATQTPRAAAYLETGTVERTTGGLRVALGDDRFEARRAKSCLVAPELGDRVLCAVEDDGVFVLAVLEGREGAATRVSVDGDLRLQAASGRVSICSGRGVDVVAVEDVAISSGQLHVRAKAGSVAIEDLGFFGRLLRADVGKVALVARELDSRLERWSQRAKRVFRFVEELEQVRAGSLDMRAEGLAAVRGENTVVSARVLAKIDGEQVHIG